MAMGSTLIVSAASLITIALLPISYGELPAAHCPFFSQHTPHGSNPRAPTLQPNLQA